MRRLITSPSKIFATLAFSVLVTLCSLGIFASHPATDTQVKANCSASCHSHGQHSAISNLENKEDEDDKEPVPPPSAAWLQTPVNLALLYVLPVFAVLWFAHKQKTILLTTQLRF